MADYDRMARVYIKMREKRSQLKREFEEKDAQIKQQMEQLERAFMQELNEHNTNSLKTDSGTIFTTESAKASIADWNALAPWLIENDALEFLEQRVKAKEVQGYLNTHGELPPGVNLHREKNVRIRKNSDK